jgi:hypothetical protein
MVLPYCYYTAGEPRAAAMINAQHIFDDKWATEAAESSLNITDIDIDNMENNTSLEAGFFNSNGIDMNNVEEFDENFNSINDVDEDTINIETKSAGL